MILFLLVCGVWILYFLLQRRRVVYDEKAISRCQRVLRNWCLRYDLPSDHGYDHFIAVFLHAHNAIREESQLSSHERTCILLAALLHDVDDRKIRAYFHANMENEIRYPMASSILDEAGCSIYRDLVLEMIALVSTSSNGNRNALPHEQRWKFIPRDCDRLEALGMIGVKRVGTGTFRARLPLRIL